MTNIFNTFIQAPVRTAVAAMVLALATSAGCQSTTQAQGATGVTTRFNGNSLRADLPLNIGVAKAIAASKKVLEDRYFVIVDTQVNADSGFVTGRPPRTNDFPRVKITAENAVTQDGQPVTRLNIGFQPMGDEFSSRDIMGKVLVELGL